MNGGRTYNEYRTEMNKKEWWDMRNTDESSELLTQQVNEDWGYPKNPQFHYQTGFLTNLESPRSTHADHVSIGFSSPAARLDHMVDYLARIQSDPPSQCNARASALWENDLLSLPLTTLKYRKLIHPCSGSIRRKKGGLIFHIHVVHHFSPLSSLHPSLAH